MKLVYHDVLDGGSCLLVDEGYVLVVDDSVEEVGCFGKEKSVGIVVLLLHGLAYLVEKHESIYVFADGLDGVQV